MYDCRVRTTIEIDDGQRAWLLELAATRREKGFSRIVREAIEVYRESLLGLGARKQALLGLRGAISSEQATYFHDRVREVRDAPWR